MNVLAVDDDIAMTELTAMLLQTHGFSVTTTNSPREAIHMVRDQNFQAILLDLMMPEMNGHQVCRAIREFSRVPIIIVSALNDPETVASALDNGADDYLVKPVPSEVLSAHLTRLIKRTGKRVAPVGPPPAWVSNTQPAKS